MSHSVAIKTSSLPTGITVGLEEREIFTQLTWKELFAHPRIPTVLLAIVECQDRLAKTRVYEGTNLREHIKYKGWFDPYTKGTIKKITWVFARVHRISKSEYTYSFSSLDELPSAFYRSLNRERAWKKNKEAFRQALEMQKPLPLDWYRSPMQPKKRIQLAAEIFCRSCNPLIEPREQARSQFITGMTLFSLNQNLAARLTSAREVIPLLQPSARAGLRLLHYAAFNGHLPSKVITALVREPLPVHPENLKRSTSQPSSGTK